MQKIEKWRLEELALVLDQMSAILRKGDHCEWANVFDHFQDESKDILSKKEFDLESLKRLIRNIKNCFQRMSSLKKLVIYDLEERRKESKEITKDFQNKIARLIKILEDMEKKTIEFIH